MRKLANFKFALVLTLATLVFASSAFAQESGDAGVFWDPAGNLLEVIWLDLADTELVIHVMDLRPKFYELLPTGEDPTT